jgi:conjugative transfer pilus assembly protein TraH
MAWRKASGFLPAGNNGKPAIKTHRLKNQIAVILAIVALFTGICHGNWEDDWLASYSASGPSYVQGNQRSYYSGGGFSARWPSTSDPLLTVSTPRMKMGCGGIDLFMGGMSFMNVNYLVQKLQSIMTAAPAAAFDIALKTLAPQVAATLKELEAIADRLNQLQLNDCTASKAMVATLMSPVASATGNANLQKEIATDITDFQTTSGFNNLYANVQSDIGNIISAAQGGKPAANNNIQTSSTTMTSGCPADYMSIFGGGSVLDNIAALKNIDLGYVMMMRGFIGDVWVAPPATTGSTFQATYIKPCDKDKNIQNFFVGDIEVRASGTGAACSPVTDTNRNLYTYTGQIMSDIASNMKAGTQLSATDLNFASSLSLTIMPMLQTAVASGTDTMVIGQLSDIAAKEYAFAMLSDLFSRNAQMIAQAHSISSATNGVSSGHDPSTCILTQFKGVETQLQSLEDTMGKVATDLRAELVKSATDLNSMQSVTDNARKMGEIVDQELSKRFGRGIARHVSGG